jgi:hypothetical protein
MWQLYTLHNVRRTLSYITLSKYVHYKKNYRRVVDINYDPFFDLLGTSTIVDRRTFRSPRE